jgi:hypothetical protein
MAITSLTYILSISQQNIGFELLHEKRLLPLILQIKEYNSEMIRRKK